jgi:hypothetical protein
MSCIGIIRRNLLRVWIIHFLTPNKHAVKKSGKSVIYLEKKIILGGMTRKLININCGFGSFDIEPLI